MIVRRLHLRAVIGRRVLLRIFRRHRFRRGRDLFAEAGVQRLQILLVQRAERRLDVQLIDQIVIARIGKLLLGVVKRRSRVKHVDDSARPHLIARFHRIQRALRGNHRLLVSVDAADRGVDVIKGGAHRLNGGAMRAFQLLAGADKRVLRLLHLRVDQAALIKRQAEAQAHLVVAGNAVALYGAAAAIFVVGQIGRGVQTERRHMAGFIIANLLARQILRQTCGQQVQVATFRLFQQRINRLRLISAEAIDIQRRQRRIVVAGYLTQRFQRVVQRIARGHFIRQHVIILRAGVLHVGDRHQADVKALRGLIELAVDRLFLRFNIGQRIDSAQHVEIGGGGIQHQILLGSLIGHILDAGIFFLQRQGAPFAHIENGLR